MNQALFAWSLLTVNECEDGAAIAVQLSRKLDLESWQIQSDLTQGPVTRTYSVHQYLCTVCQKQKRLTRVEWAQKRD